MSHLCRRLYATSSRTTVVGCMSSLDCAGRGVHHTHNTCRHAGLLKWLGMPWLVQYDGSTTVLLYCCSAHVTHSLRVSAADWHGAGGWGRGWRTQLCFVASTAAAICALSSCAPQQHTVRVFVGPQHGAVPTSAICLPLMSMCLCVHTVSRLLLCMRHIESQPVQVAFSGSGSG